MIRLLNVFTFQLQEFDENAVPPYAIASHRWQKDEPTYKDVLKGRHDATGFAKVRGFCNWLQSFAPRFFPPALDWLWIDTCCIDKKSSAELSEAINSMYNWYAEAEFCIAYLYDCQEHHDHISFEYSEWFRRGWTLQELIAPSLVILLDKDWTMIGHKDGTKQAGRSTSLPFIVGKDINRRISKCTGIPEEVLSDPTMLQTIDVDARLSWMARRTTTKIEDQAYCLLGIFNVCIPLIYGERQQATTRLLEEILRKHVRRTRSDGNSARPSPRTYPTSERSTQMTPDNLSDTIKALQDRISKLELQNEIGHNRRTSKRAAQATSSDKSLSEQFNDMLTQFNDLQQQTMTENLEMQKAQAFWNPLEHMGKGRDTTV